ncbi:MAG: hypothetical protein NTW58_10600 [Actinobacteria bacterium]|nr:hypothetical protein [Actinomycetota bacterium]
MRFRGAVVVLCLVFAFLLAVASLAVAAPRSGGESPANVTAQAPDLAGVFVAPALLAVVQAHQTTCVYITDTGVKYHRKGCRSLAKSHYKKTLSWVKSRGYKPCKVCNPLHTDQVPAEVRMHSRFENAAQKHTDAPDENESWVTFDGVTPVSDPTSFTVRAATKAHRDYAKRVSTFNRRGFNATVRAITIRSLNRAANGLADLIVALGRAAPPPSPSPSPSISPSPSPTVTPTPSPSPTPTRVLSVSGSVSDSSPAQYSNVTAYCKAVDQRGMAISGVRVSLTWHYKTTSPAETWTSGSSGVAACTRNISGATKGDTVYISMSASWEGQYASASASFTPR